MKYAVALAAAALGFAAQADAATYLFTLTGDYDATWTLDSDPTPAPEDVFSYKFVLKNVAGDFAGTADNSVVIDFYTDALLGGLTISDEVAGPVLADAYATQLFSGSTDHPHFELGTYTLVNNHGVNPYTLVISEAAAVPEPATWAMMIAGFGVVGGAMRRRTSVKVAYAA